MFFWLKLLSLFIGVIPLTVLHAKMTEVRSLLEKNRLTEALTVCQQYEALPSSEREIVFACGWVYLRLEKYEMVEKVFEKLKKQSHLPEYSLLQAFQYALKGNYEESQKILSSIVKENKGTPVGTFAQEINAEVYEMQGNLAAASFIYRGIYTENPNRPRVNWGLGRYYLSQGDTKRALQHLEKTVALWPKHLASRFNLALIYLSQVGTPELVNESNKQALKWLTECYRLNKADAGVLEQLGNYFERTGKIAEALKYWQKAVTVNKNSIVAKEKINLHFGAEMDQLIEKNRYQEALTRIDSAPKNLVEDPKFQLKRGIIYRNLGKYEKALVELQSYIKVSQNDAIAFREIGISFVNLKKIEEAKEAFGKAIANDPTSGLNYGWLAFILEATGELISAKEMWQKAQELIKDPIELDKANRKISSIEKKIKKRSKKEE